VTARQALLVGVLAAVWGSSYLLIKIAVDGFSPAELVLVRAVVAAAVLWAMLAWQGDAVARRTLADMRRRPRWALAFGLVGVAAPFVLISYGELEVPSGLTAVLIAPAPIFVALLAPLIDHSERISRRQAVGLGAGLAGVALVVGVDLVDTWLELFGAVAIIAAALCYALAGYVVKRRYAGMPATATSAISCSVAAVLTAPLALATASGHSPDAGETVAAVVLGVVHTALALAILYHLIGEIGPGRANLVNYLIPAVALGYGALLLGERITVAALAGLVAVLVGVALASGHRGASETSAERAEAPAVAAEPLPVARR
jgi:drug/metabolite transporter (DMT)-like permease